MDIDSYEEYKEEISYDKVEDSNYYKKYIIKNLEEFFKLIYLHFTIFDNKEVFYRGQGNKEWNLETSIFRRDILSSENELLEILMNNRPRIFNKCKNSIEKLTLMQHYGSPTRLLDITANPLVALYFACEDKNNRKDGIVHIFEENICGKKENRSYIDIISNFAFFENNRTIEEFKDYLQNEGFFYKNAIINRALKQNKILLRSTKNNERIIAQQGNFYLFANNIEINEDKKDSIIKKRSFEIESDGTILIDKNCKDSILKELNVIGIKKSVIYPELENYAEEFIKIHKNNLKFDNTEIINIKKNIIKKVVEPVVEPVTKKNIQRIEKKLRFLKNKLLEKELKETIINKFIKTIEEAIGSNDDWLDFKSKKSQVKLKIKRFLLKNKVNIAKEEVYNILVGEKEGKNG